jgi:signal transduction histidine kinase
VSRNGGPRRARHLSIWTEPLAGAPRDGRDDVAVDTGELEDRAAMATLTHDLLGGLAVVRGVARLLLQDAELPADERRSLLTVLDRQVDLMEHTLSGVALERGWSADPFAVDGVSRG